MKTYLDKRWVFVYIYKAPFHKTMKDNIKKAVESAEQEIQEKEIKNLKNIIKDLLEEKKSKEEKKREIEKEISIIKQSIDDFKSGRLDKIKELQEKDEVAQKLLKFQINIINQPIITQPWGWHYQVVPMYYRGGITSVDSNIYYCGDSTTLTTQSCSSLSRIASNGMAGNTYATFTSGSYNVNGGIVNL